MCDHCGCRDLTTVARLMDEHGPHAAPDGRGVTAAARPLGGQGTRPLTISSTSATGRRGVEGPKASRLAA